MSCGAAGSIALDILEMKPSLHPCAIRTTPFYHLDLYLLCPFRKLMSLSHAWRWGTWTNKRNKRGTRNEARDAEERRQRNSERRVPGSLAALRKSLVKSKLCCQQSTQARAGALWSPPLLSLITTTYTTRLLLFMFLSWVSHSSALSNKLSCLFES